MQHAHTDVTLSVKIPPKMRIQLTDLSHNTGKTKSFLTSEAIKHYLMVQAYQIKGIQKAVKKANSKDAKFISHDKVVKWLNTWGTPEEQEFPT